MSCIFEKLAGKKITLEDSIKGNVMNVMLYIWRYYSNTDIDMLYKLIMRYEKRIDKLKIEIVGDTLRFYIIPRHNSDGFVLSAMKF